LSRNNRRTYYNTFAASAELACGQPLQEAPSKENRQPTTFYVLPGTLIEKCSFWISCQFNAKSGAINQVTLDDQLVDAIHPLATPDIFQPLSYISFGWNFEDSSSILYSQPLLKNSLSL